MASSLRLQVVISIKRLLRQDDKGENLQQDIELWYGYQKPNAQLFVKGPARLGAHSELVRPGDSSVSLQAQQPLHPFVYAEHLSVKHVTSGAKCVLVMRHNSLTSDCENAIVY